MRESHTTVLERNRLWRGEYQTEPYEAAWAGEAIFFVRSLEASGTAKGCEAAVQISPDGVHWCDEGTRVPLPAGPDVTFGRDEPLAVPTALARAVEHGEVLGLQVDAVAGRWFAPLLRSKLSSGRKRSQ